jgi:hypothetical protein
VSGVPTEWQMVLIASAYNAYFDADACCIQMMANAGFFQHYPLATRYTFTCLLKPNAVVKNLQLSNKATNKIQFQPWKISEKWVSLIQITKSFVTTILCFMLVTMTVLLGSTTFSNEIGTILFVDKYP